MATNLTAYYLAIQTERARLPKQAAQGWIAEQATSSLPHHGASLSMRRWLGRAMILAGARVQGMPLATVTAMEPKHAR